MELREKGEKKEKEKKVYKLYEMFSCSDSAICPRRAAVTVAAKLAVWNFPLKVANYY